MAKLIEQPLNKILASVPEISYTLVTTNLMGHDTTELHVSNEDGTINKYVVLAQYPDTHFILNCLLLIQVSPVHDYMKFLPYRGVIGILE